VAVATVAIAAQAVASDTFRYLMTVDGIANSPFAVQSFNWGLSNPVNYTSGGGIGTGRVSISSFNIMKSFDNSDPGFIAACAQGTHIANARVRGYKNGSMTPFLDILLEDVFIESHQTSGSTGNSAPACSVSMFFLSMTINGVSISQAVASNPVELNKVIASITQKALATSPKAKQKVTVH